MLLYGDLKRMFSNKYLINSRILKSVLCSGMLCFAAQVNAASWTLTPNSQVGFDIDSLGVTLVKGQFNKVQSSMTFDAQSPQNASTNFVMDTNSLSLSKPSMQKMILGEDLFYVQKYKTVHFKSTTFKALGNNKYTISGNLTIRDVTRPVKFDTTLTPNPSNPKLLDVESSTLINRTDFGMKKAIGGIGEKVNIQLKGQWQTS